MVDNSSLKNGIVARPPRVRFCPSPTGTPHVGLLRTALFNFAFARHNNGALVFRIEDTDRARDSQESYEQLIAALTWLGIEWDEGPDIGGPYQPYRQSLRGEVYRDVLERLQQADLVYESFSTPEEVADRHRAAGRRPELGYDNYDRTLTEAQKEEFRSDGRQPVLRLRMPDVDLSWTDLVRGTTTFAAGSVPDYALTRADGSPLYTFVNPVDDAVMGITHVLRGEDLLPSTPRQIALYSALQQVGVTDFTPEFGHLPYVTGTGNKKLSKRDPESSFFHHVDRGFISEGLVNYLALLGWGYAADNDIFSLEEMIAVFDIHNVNSNPARFDQKKADAINAEHIRRLTVADFTARLNQYLITRGNIAADRVDHREILAQIAPFIQTRIVVLSDAWPLIKFLFIEEEDFTYDSALANKNLGAEAPQVLQTAREVIENIPEESWNDEHIEQVLKSALIEKLALSPRKALSPVRYAISGSPVSPPLFESIRVLGRTKTLQRLAYAKDYSKQLS